jgi:hypothetical protein
MEFVLDAAIAVAEEYAHDDNADLRLVALMTPAVQRSADKQYHFVNAIVNSQEGAGIVKICLDTEQGVAWDTRNLSRHDVAAIAERELEVAKTRLAFLGNVLRGLRGCAK